MLDLITDRMITDVNRAKALKAKIKLSGWSSLTVSEQTEWLLPMKGRYEYSDMNRVGDAISYLAGLLNGYGYSVTVNPKTDWASKDRPTAAQRASYITDINAIKSRFYGTTEIPSAVDHIIHTEANNIELLLLAVEAYIINMIAGFRKCGTFKSGQGVILP